MSTARVTLVGRRPADEALEHILDDYKILQHSVFESRGVIVPKIEYRESADVGQDELELRVDDRVVGSYSTWLLDYEESCQRLLPDLEMNAAAFVGPPLVERYL